MLQTKRDHLAEGPRAISAATSSGPCARASANARVTGPGSAATNTATDGGQGRRLLRMPLLLPQSMLMVRHKAALPAAQQTSVVAPQASVTPKAASTSTSQIAKSTGDRNPSKAVMQNHDDNKVLLRRQTSEAHTSSAAGRVVKGTALSSSSSHKGITSMQQPHRPSTADRQDAIISRLPAKKTGTAAGIKSPLSAINANNSQQQQPTKTKADR